jgi:hypothetical protein
MVVNDVRKIHMCGLSLQHQKIDDAGSHDDSDEQSNSEGGGWPHNSNLTSLSAG